MELLEGLLSRRSIRRFTAEDVDAAAVRRILLAASFAPSGLNNQPWRFVIVRDPALRDRLAGLTRYGRILREAPAAIVVLLDRAAMYHETKDHQAVGACIQNMLLAAHALGLGAVWLGEILKNAAEVLRAVEAPEGHELMAVVALGHPAAEPSPPPRRDLSELVIREL